MDIWIGLVLVIVAVASFFAGRFFAPNQQEIKDLTNQLAEKESAHQEYREQVAEHLAGSARKFSKVTQEYRELYEHLASGAQELCERRSIPRELSTSHVNILAVESPGTAPQIEPKVTEPSVVNVSSTNLSPISDTDQALLDEHNSHQEGAVVIDLDKQRSEAADDAEMAPAKDYAVKDKGVINHNSLNRDDVQT